MDFVELTKEEFKRFYSGREDENFMQTIDFGNLKESQGKEVLYLGVKEDEEIKCAALIYEDINFLGKKIYYSPRGFLIDFHNIKLLTFFTEELKKFLKKKNAFKLVIDPYLIYRERDKDGELLENDNKDDEALNNLINIGFKHFGFNTYLEARQVRWAYRMKLDESYEEKKQQFSKSTRKNIETSISNGLSIKVGTEDDIDEMQSLFQDTADRKHFYYRSKDYYKEMYKCMKGLMTIYFAHLDPYNYLKSVEKRLKEEKETLNTINNKMEHDMVGAKLSSQKEICINRIKKLEDEYKEAVKYKQNNPNGLNIACLLSMKNGREYLTLTSGSLEEYRKFVPKYAMYDAHIKDAYKNGYEYCNFYGISGNFKKENNPFYGVYEFKRGFGGSVIEYIGEFELSISIFDKIYNLFRKIKKIIKKCIS